MYLKALVLYLFGCTVTTAAQEVNPKGMSSGQEKRIFNIEAFKYKKVVDPKYGDETWKILELAINDIYNHRESGIDFEELYRHGFNMVLHGFGEKLYSGLVSTLTFHLQNMSKCIEEVYDDSFLEELNSKWNHHHQSVERIRSMFMYMDRTFIPSTCRTPVYQLGLNLWRDNVIRAGEIRTRILNAVLGLIRSGEAIDEGLIRNTIKMLMDLGPLVYEEDFEKPFLEVSDAAETNLVVKLKTESGGVFTEMKRFQDA